MARDPACVFCKIVALEIPAAIVYNATESIAFLEIGPLADGHLLVIPRNHYARLVDVPTAQCGEIASLIPILGRALLDVTGADGFNVLVNNGPAAGQVVDHVHWHLIPRRQGDSLGYRWNAGKYPPGRLDELARTYQKVLAQPAA